MVDVEIEARLWFSGKIAISQKIAIISKGGCPEIGLRTGFLNVSVDVLALVPRNDLKIGSIILTRRDGEVWRGPGNL